ncbi:MAG TPA: ABC transporter substrate-binding protein, partial [Acidobacteriota bacterium]|nr:ABC transporter substrate-binding protein [Acidobacteriota bacterium]
MVTRSLWQLAMMVAALAVGAARAWSAGSLDRVVLQLPYTHQFQFAGYYAAQTQGYFAAEGLEVELREGGAVRRPYSELAAGRAQYGIGSATYLLDRLNGAPLVLVASVYQHSLLALMVLADSDIRAPEDLRGKLLAAGSSGRYPEIAAMFAAEGLPPEAYVRVEDRWDVDEIVTGEADAQAVFITDLPHDMQQKGIAVRMIRPADYGVDFYGDGLFTTETELARNPARVAAMRRAVIRGWEYALAHPEE